MSSQFSCVIALDFAPGQKLLTIFKISIDMGSGDDITG